MARCPDCNKFTGKNVEEEPEVTSEPELVVAEGLATVSMSVKIVNQCEECSTELEETEFDLSGSLDMADHQEDDHELSIADTTVERSDSGGGRYAKRMFGVEAVVKLDCSCGEGPFEITMKDEIASSQMESLV